MRQLARRPVQVPLTRIPPPPVEQQPQRPLAGRRVELLPNCEDWRYVLGFRRRNQRQDTGSIETQAQRDKLSLRQRNPPRDRARRRLSGRVTTGEKRVRVLVRGAFNFVGQEGRQVKEAAALRKSDVRRDKRRKTDPVTTENVAANPVAIATAKC